MEKEIEYYKKQISSATDIRNIMTITAIVIGISSITIGL